MDETSVAYTAFWNVIATTAMIVASIGLPCGMNALNVQM